ncbi:MAG: cupin domain-containing protein [ANME-2 cluster archaeon]|nr:cupin domain-containing protein [ANME-2 cluster archaeon]
MDIQLIDFEKEVQKLESPRRPHDMVFVDDSLLRAVLCQGEGKWYIHDYDELFLHHKGTVVIESDNSTYELKPGTCILVPAGVRHRTNSEGKGVFLVFRHKQTACMLA